jgi:hypothetical protein
MITTTQETTNEKQLKMHALANILAVHSLFI